MTLAQRILDLLDGIPLSFPTPRIVAHCGAGLKCPRSTVWEQLRRLERAGRVVKVSAGRWQSVKWWELKGA